MKGGEKKGGKLVTEACCESFGRRMCRNACVRHMSTSFEGPLPHNVIITARVRPLDPELGYTVLKCQRFIVMSDSKRPLTRQGKKWRRHVETLQQLCPPPRKPRSAGSKRKRSRSRSPHLSPNRLHPRPNGSAPGSTSTSRGPAPVYLLTERAKGKAGARRLDNQVTFMRVMGLVGGDPADGDDTAVWECPLSDKQIWVLVTASTHEYFAGMRKEGCNDGIFE